VEKNGAWVVRVSVPETRAAGTKSVPDPTGKTTGVIVAVEEAGWFDYDLTVDGRQVRAVGADGKAIDPKDLPKRLAKPARVVLFRGAGEPDPHYLGVLRDDVIVLVAPADKFKAPAPKK